MLCLGFQHLIYFFITHLCHFCFFCHSAEFHENLLIFLHAKSSVLLIDISLASFSLNSNFPSSKTGIDTLEFFFHWHCSRKLVNGKTYKHIFYHTKLLKWHFLYYLLLFPRTPNGHQKDLTRSIIIFPRK